MVLQEENTEVVVEEAEEEDERIRQHGRDQRTRVLDNK